MRASIHNKMVICYPKHHNTAWVPWYYNAVLPSVFVDSQPLAIYVTTVHHYNNSAVQRGLERSSQHLHCNTSPSPICVLQSMMLVQLSTSSYMENLLKFVFTLKIIV